MHLWTRPPRLKTNYKKPVINCITFTYSFSVASLNGKPVLVCTTLAAVSSPFGESPHLRCFRASWKLFLDVGSCLFPLEFLFFLHEFLAPAYVAQTRTNVVALKKKEKKRKHAPHGSKNFLPSCAYRTRCSIFYFKQIRLSPRPVALRFREWRVY